MRDGQRAFNLLYRYYPDIAGRITGSEFDPFYDDAKLELFYSEVGRLLILRLESKDDIIGDFE